MPLWLRKFGGKDRQPSEGNPHLFSPVFRFRDSLEVNMVTVVAICTDHRVSTYRLPTLTEPLTQLKHQSRPGWPDRDGAAAPESRKTRAEPAKDCSTLEGRKEFVCLFHLSKTCLTYLCVCSPEEDVLRPPVARPAGIKLADRQVERLRKAAEKAEQARAKIEKRKQEWAQL